jgi:hypothetical protein
VGGDKERHSLRIVMEFERVVIEETAVAIFACAWSQKCGPRQFHCVEGAVVYSLYAIVHTFDVSFDQIDLREKTARIALAFP